MKCPRSMASSFLSDFIVNIFGCSRGYGSVHNARATQSGCQVFLVSVMNFSERTVVILSTKPVHNRPLSRASFCQEQNLMQPIGKISLVNSELVDQGASLPRHPSGMRTSKKRPREGLSMNQASSTSLGRGIGANT